jgi:hypothetical protein
VIEPEKKADGKEGAAQARGRPDPKEYFGYKRDLESLCEFMGRWLSDNGRWGSPSLHRRARATAAIASDRLARIAAGGTAGNRPQRGDSSLAPALEITGHRSGSTTTSSAGVDRSPDEAAAGRAPSALERVPEEGPSLEKSLRAEPRSSRERRLRVVLTRGASMAAPKERDADRSV